MTHAGSCVLADRFTEDRSVWLDLVWVVGFTLLTAVMAQFEIRLPFTPVPLTGQTFAVLLSGAVLGSRRGFSSQAVYLAAGAAGMPVFAGGGFSLAHLLGPTGGYLWSYPFAAALTGWWVERGAGRVAWKLAAALVVSDAFILFSGASWLRLLFNVSIGRALLLGFYPFLIGDILKLVLVGLSLPRVLARYDRTGREPK